MKTNLLMFLLLCSNHQLHQTPLPGSCQLHKQVFLHSRCPDHNLLPQLHIFQYNSYHLQCSYSHYSEVLKKIKFLSFWGVSSFQFLDRCFWGNWKIPVFSDGHGALYFTESVGWLGGLLVHGKNLYNSYLSHFSTDWDEILYGELYE